MTEASKYKASERHSRTTEHASDVADGAAGGGAEFWAVGPASSLSARDIVRGVGAGLTWFADGVYRVAGGRMTFEPAEVGATAPGGDQ